MRHAVTHAMLQWISAPPAVELGRPAPLPSSSPHFSFLGNTMHGTVGYFSSGWPVAYLVATVIFGIGIASGPSSMCPSRCRLPSNRNRLRSNSGGCPNRRWKSLAGSPAWSIASGASCEYGSRSLGNHPFRSADKCILASGLMEITYDTGAKVILQGPVDV